MTLDERERYCLMAYVTLSCSLNWDESQPYRFHRVWVTLIRENTKYYKLGSNQNIISYSTWMMLMPTLRNCSKNKDIQRKQKYCRLKFWIEGIKLLA